MAIGDDAEAVGYSLVPESGSEDARVRYGAREINRTRDYLAQFRAVTPFNKTGYRQASGISSGTALPTGGSDGDIYFQVI